MASIQFKTVAKRFDAVSVIENLDLEIKDHELMVFVGPSGCGKSTALRLIAGLETVTDGSLYIGDRLVNQVAPKDRDVAMVFQSYALYPHLTVRQNISFGLEIRKVPQTEIDKLVREAAEILGLTPLLDRKPKALSGGQRQRVALGRAIVRKPAVFLFDEPLSNLDAELRVQMRAEISRLQHRLKTTTVYVTHDQVEAMTLGHRIAVLSPLNADRKTNLRQCGTPLELYDRPGNVFVAKFIGTPPMNMMRATVGEDGVRLTTSGFVASAPARFRAALQAHRGREVLLGVRPEHVSEPGVHPWRETAPLQATTELLETIGHEGILHGRCGKDVMVARLAAHRMMTFGAPIDLVVNCDAFHLFDPASELRLAEQ